MIYIFVTFGGRVFQQTIGIRMGTNCSPLLADLFLYSYEADFVQELLRKNDKKLALSFNFTFRYIDDVLSLNNSKLGTMLIASIPINLKLRIRQTQPRLLRTLTCSLKLTMKVG